MRQPLTAREIVDAFGGGIGLANALARVSGLTAAPGQKTCNMWAQRGSIPGHMLLAVSMAARRVRPIGPGGQVITQTTLLEHAARDVMTFKEESEQDGEDDNDRAERERGDRGDEEEAEEAVYQ